MGQGARGAPGVFPARLGEELVGDGLQVDSLVVRRVVHPTPLSHDSTSPRLAG